MPPRPTRDEDEDEDEEKYEGRQYDEEGEGEEQEDSDEDGSAYEGEGDGEASDWDENAYDDNQTAQQGQGQGQWQEDDEEEEHYQAQAQEDDDDSDDEYEPQGDAQVNPHAAESQYLQEQHYAADMEHSSAPVSVGSSPGPEETGPGQGHLCDPCMFGSCSYGNQEAQSSSTPYLGHNGHRVVIPRDQVCECCQWDPNAPMD
ncbi:hypothetical protein P171DRAFT_482880 [Karstenula rhodostoma CBS 690.94]|uniref:Uncharacterized protein n=1 Tax=Karstenula rhodostoma CBS 690.94 TaxID=1392251 RepID=A0A9P4PMR8_9PLEO|nr:hypothetical protein P171DRAFT_482880 [Karstenula rhodostoma CBS 690.94]